jgi:uncharacterized membrane-anchored protein YitT (DUF2179 family)
MTQSSQQTISKRPLTNYERAKAYRQRKISFQSLLKDIFLMMIGIGSAAFGLKSFLLPSNFIDGGATGIALLLGEITNLQFPVLLLLVNAPFVFFGYHTLGRTFFIKTTLAIIGLALATAFISFPHVTNDKLLVASFGGFFLGAGIGFAIRGGSVIDGTEVLALHLSKKVGGSVGDIILVINVVVFSVAAYILSIDTALYALITYLAAAKTVDFVVEGIEEYTGVTIISSHSAEINEMITQQLGRGVTNYKGKGGFGTQGHSKEKDILYTVVTRLEISSLKTEVHKIDPYAFMVMNSIKDVKGGLIKKRRLKGN